MKLHNITLLILSFVLLFVTSIWSVFFYYDLLDEVYDSLDDGLVNSKLLIVQKAVDNNEIAEKAIFSEGNYAFTRLPKLETRPQDRFSDTLIFTLNENDYEPFRMLTSVVQIDEDEWYELRIITSMVEEDDLIEDLMFSVFLFFGIMLVVVIILNRILLSRTWKPFYKLLENLRKFHLGTHNTIELPKTKIKEFNELYEASKELIDNNIRVYNQQNQFISSASHELQTPLAISINKLELLIEEGKLGEKEIEMTDKVVQALEKLVRINKSLLLISRIESKQFIKNETIDIEMLFKSTIASFKEIIDYKKITVQLEVEEKCTPSMDKSLAEILVVNLMKNALTYNIKQGYIKIIIVKDGFTISNAGIMAPLDNSKMFQRFNKDNYNTQSIGLGLSIVKSIVELYNSTIIYSYNDDHQFSIKFKREE